ncbi:MAG: hypothetical protein WCS03_02600 [Bacteroidota bacterium]
MGSLKFLFLKLILFSVILIILDYAVGSTLESLYFSKRSLSNENNKLNYSLNQANEDLLIFGSSTAYHGYIPKIFEDSLKMSCYNVGQNLMDIYFHYALLNSILQRYTPRIIILDLTAWDFVKSNDDFEILSDLYPFYYSNVSVKEVVDLPGNCEKVKMLSKIYRYNSKMLFILKNNIIKSNEGEKGYIPLYARWTDKIAIDTSGVFLTDAFKFSYLDKFIDNACDKGSKLIIIASPSFCIFTKNQYLELEKYLDKKGVTFWNYRNDTTFINHQEYYYNVTHLNNSGAEKFTKIIASRLKSQL